MNIDSSNILSLLSSGEGLEKLQQTIQTDEGLSREFAETLLDKIRQLTGIGTDEYLPENHISNDGNKQHGIAGLLNERGNGEDFINVNGKGLPIKKLEKDIDLENTLEALASVMNTLEDGSLERGDLEAKLELLLEKVEAIRSTIPGQIELDEKLGKIVDELQTIKNDISTYESKEINTAQVIDEGGRVVPEEIMDQSQLNQEKIATDGGSPFAKLTERLDTVVDALKQIKDIVFEGSSLPQEADLEHQIERLTTEIAYIKDIFSEKSASKLAEEKDITNQLLPLEGGEDADDDLQLANQIAAIVTALNEPQDREKMTVLPAVQESKPEQKKEALSLKQMAEERALGIVSKSETETLLQQENANRKPGQDNPAIIAKQNQKTDFLDADAKKPESGTEKVLPRFATDIANLNRAVMHENKSDLAPMTKHFAHPQWNKEVAERVIWMHKQEIPSAELRLNPRHLGPITIRVDVTQEQVTVAFTAQHAAVKEAIEATLPKLREMFSAQQLNLVDVNVSQDDAGQRQARSFAQMGSGSGKNGQQGKDEMANNEQAERAQEITDEIEAGRAIASNGILSIFA